MPKHTVYTIQTQEGYMPKHAVYTIQLDKAQRAALAQMATARGCSVAVLVREAVEDKTGVGSSIGCSGRPAGS